MQVKQASSSILLRSPASKQIERRVVSGEAMLIACGDCNLPALVEKKLFCVLASDIRLVEVPPQPDLLDGKL